MKPVSGVRGCGVFALFLATAASAQDQEKYEGSCSATACHGAYKSAGIVHAPVEADTCDACHQAVEGGKHKFRLAASDAKLCTECHDAFEGKTIHQPVGQGPCTACHDPHASKTPRLLKADSLKALCLDCHDDVLPDVASIHGPAAAGECTACHNPHASPHPKLLTAAGPALCYECHDDVKEKVSDRKHVHAPVKDDCTSCHNPHASPHKWMLTAPPPALCLDCHDDVAKLAEDATVKHSPITKDAACMTCHDVHGSNHAGMLLKPAGEICLSCHNQALTGARGKLLNVAEHLKTNDNPHGPVRDGECQACHAPHGGDNAALLAKAYPAKFYSPYGEDRYALCFECHEAAAFAEVTTDDATEFRNGRQNLHYLHVNKADKGRTCRACHDPHAAKNAKYIADRVPFGDWNLPVNFKQTETGGSCGPGCHRPYRYDRETPVENIPPLATAQEK
ncbi:MAG: cytochrome c3 family protein [Planctomycetota bacterium]